MKIGSKYYPLHLHLDASTQDSITLHLDTIETILGAPLPSSARVQRGWWSNRSQSNAQSAAWMDAGYHVSHIDLDKGAVTFTRPSFVYHVETVGDTILWTSEMVRGLRRFLKMTQEELAEKLGVRQQTVSEWEKGVYAPSRATSKYLGMVAEKAGFAYEIKPDSDSI